MLKREYGNAVHQRETQRDNTNGNRHLKESGHPFRKFGRSSQMDVLREVGAQNLIELVQFVVAHAHEQESEDRLARILDSA